MLGITVTLTNIAMLAVISTPATVVNFNICDYCEALYNCEACDYRIVQLTTVATFMAVVTLVTIAILATIANLANIVTLAILATLSRLLLRSQLFFRKLQ